MPALRADAGPIAGVILEAFMYGIYLVTFFQALPTLLRTGSAWKSISSIHWATLSVFLLLWINGTLNFCLGVVRNLQVQLPKEDQYTDWINVVKPLNVSVQNILAGGLLIYRCWIVNSRRGIVVVLPIALWMAGTGTSITVWNLQTRSKLHLPVNLDLLQVLGVLFWGVTVALNLYTTMGIAYRIWEVQQQCTATRISATHLEDRIENQGPKSGSPDLEMAFRIVIESGAIYTLTSIGALITACIGNDSLYLTSAADIMAVGIAFNLVIVRVAKERKRQNDSWQPPQSRVATMKFQNSVAISSMHPEQSNLDRERQDTLPRYPIPLKIPGSGSPYVDMPVVTVT